MHRNSILLRPAHRTSAGPASPGPARKPPLAQRASAAASEEKRIARRVSIHPETRPPPSEHSQPHRERGGLEEQQPQGLAACEGCDLRGPLRPPHTSAFPSAPRALPSLPDSQPLPLRSYPGSFPSAPGSPSAAPRRPAYPSAISPPPPRLLLRAQLHSAPLRARGAPRMPRRRRRAVLPPLLARSAGPVSWRRRRRSWRWTSKATRRRRPERWRRWGELRAVSCAERVPSPPTLGVRGRAAPEPRAVSPPLAEGAAPARPRSPGASGGDLGVSLGALWRGEHQC